MIEKTTENTTLDIIDNIALLTQHIHSCLCLCITIIEVIKSEVLMSVPGLVLSWSGKESETLPTRLL